VFLDRLRSLKQNWMIACCFLRMKKYELYVGLLEMT